MTDSDRLIAWLDYPYPVDPTGGKNMTAHTPGPWNVEASVNCDGCETLVEQGSYVIADCWPDRFVKSNMTHDYETCKANARLIASAPALLAALKDVADRIQAGDRFERLPPWAQEIVSQARAAIAQAQGGKP